MMKLESVGEVIWARTLEWLQESGARTEVRLLLGKPQHFPDSTDYYCAYQIKGVGSEEVKYERGTGSYQAMELAQQALRAELDLLKQELGGTLSWEPSSPKRLVRESPWMRVYQEGPRNFRYESKFLTDGLEVSASSIKGMWKGLSPEDQREFALAFSLKRPLTSEDEKILDFLMEAGSPGVWSNMALMLTQHSDRERVLRFLLERVETERERENYYQALAQMNDSRAIPVLERQYEAHKKAGGLFKSELDLAEYARVHDYLACCEALLALSGSKQFETALEEMLAHPNERVHHSAGLRLARWKSPLK